MADRAAGTQGTTFGVLLRRHRLEAGLSQEALAERAGISLDAVAALERGRRSSPRPATLALLADALALAGDQRAALIAAATGATTEPPITAETVTAESFRPALPTPATPIIGREREEAELLHLLQPEDGAGVRLLTLIGPGGIGKTRLALHAAAAAESGYEHGACFVDLAPTTDVAAAGTAIAGALGIRLSGRESPWDAVAGALRDREMLLLLDNVEQVVEAATDLARLLEACPRLAILATSRIALRVRAERQFQVPPLEVPAERGSSAALIQGIPAVRLFAARAQAVHPGFALAEDDAPLVAEICRRLDGLPLAIELAAARIRLLPPAALLDRLQQRLGILTGGSRDMPARQQTMRNAIEWSYGLLDTGSRALYARLAVFAGGAPLDAVEAICGQDGQDGLIDIETLLDSSLVFQAGGAEPRIGMLETIREHARECLARSGEDDELRGAHARYFLTLAEKTVPELAGSGQKAALEQLRREDGNLTAALTWLVERGEAEAALRLAGALWRMWFIGGQARAGKLRVDTVLKLEGARQVELKPLLAEVLHGATGLALQLGDLNEGVTLGRESLALARELGDPVATADALNALANILRNRGETRDAVPLYEEALALYRQTDNGMDAAGPQRGISVTLNNLGTAVRKLGDNARAVALHEESLAIRRQLDDTWGVALILFNLGMAAFDRGDLTRAIEAGEETLALSRTLGNNHGVALALDLLARISQAGGDVDRAARLFGESLRVSRDVGDQGLIADSLMGFADILARSGDAARAARLLAAAVTLQAAVRSTEEWGARRDATVAVIQADLDERSFEAAWKAGEAMPWREALEEVLAFAS